MEKSEVTNFKTNMSNLISDISKSGYLTIVHKSGIIDVPIKAIEIRTKLSNQRPLMYYEDELVVWYGKDRAELAEKIKSIRNFS